MDSDKTAGVELPFQENSHFKKFEIKYRNREFIEDVKKVLASLEKDGPLLNLIPIAFNDDLDREVQLNSLFVDTVDSIYIIWNFILISFRFYGNQKGCIHTEYSTLLLAECEVIIDIFNYCVNINLLGRRDIEIGTNASTSSRNDTNVVMEETLVLRVMGHLGSISLTDLILS